MKDKWFAPGDLAVIDPDDNERSFNLWAANSHGRIAGAPLIVGISPGSTVLVLCFQSSRRYVYVLVRGQVGYVSHQALKRSRKNRGIAR